MKHIYITLIFLVFHALCSANIYNYQSLDQANPIIFSGTHITYNNQKIALGKKAIFIDGQLSNDEAAQFPFVYNSINDAAKHLTNGTEETPMVLYIAPYVYWIDNPDATGIRTGKNGSTPYGLEIECEWLRFYGLTDDAHNVVMACNRGQTIGAQGNFTMFKILGNGISSENVTFGNFCNVDLTFPLKPELNRKKRASAIVQAQLIHCNGDKIIARNTRFISRLNLCNFVGAKRILFDNCHMECTDDALCGTGVYLNCTFDFHSSKPFYHTTGTGAVFLNCDIHSLSGNNQYFTKAGGQIAIIDTRFISAKEKYISWRDANKVATKNYQHHVTLNGKPYFIGAKNAESTIVLKDKSLLNAYKISTADTTIYNIYNLLKGDDKWDPMAMKATIAGAEKYSKKRYTNIPVQMRLFPGYAYIETDKDTLTLKSDLYRFGNFPSSDSTISWYLDNKYSSLARIEPFADGAMCNVIPTNSNNDTRQIVVIARTASGLEAASEIKVAPKSVDPPAFKKRPKLRKTNNGALQVSYTLDMEFEDQSVIEWYRCTDKNGNAPIKVAVSRFNKPLLNYTLSKADIGYYIMVSVAPKHIRCTAGEEQTYITKKAITVNDINTTSGLLETDFKNVAVNNQLLVQKGFWTFKPLATEKNGQIIPVDNTKDAWYYGEGSQGNANMNGLLQTGRSATMLYTPVNEDCGDMIMQLTVSPYKTAGQGFSVAPLHMDVLIKFDTENMNGYGLRFQRTTKYGKAVDCYFVKYTNGKAKQIGENITTSCYRSPCHIQLSVQDNMLTAKATTTKDYSNPKQSEIVSEVNIETPIDKSNFGGIGILYNGGSTTMINRLKVEWK